MRVSLCVSGDIGLDAEHRALWCWAAPCWEGRAVKRKQVNSEYQNGLST